MRSVLALLLCTALFAGCRSEPAGAPAAADSAATPAPGAGQAAPATGDTFEIQAGDDMRFSLTAFSVAAGDTVAVTLHNTGGLPKETFGHNFVLLGRTVDVDAFLADALGARDTEYVPAARAADVVAHTRLLGPDERETITFTAPTEPGTYTFVCSFPGHGAVMRGTMTVTAAP